MIVLALNVKVLGRFYFFYRYNKINMRFIHRTNTLEMSCSGNEECWNSFSWRESIPKFYYYKNGSEITRFILCNEAWSKTWQNKKIWSI